jgi:hypothetical protein
MDRSERGPRMRIEESASAKRMWVVAIVWEEVLLLAKSWKRFPASRGGEVVEKKGRVLGMGLVIDYTSGGINGG